MDNIRIKNTGYLVSGEYLWEVSKRGWFFFPMFPTLIWAKTAQLAVERFLHGDV